MGLNRLKKEDSENGKTEDVFAQRAAQRKRLFSVIAAAGIVAITIGMFSLVNTITAPFPKTQNANNSTTTDQAALEELKRRDTDNDGLKDYDEIFQYRTSVFVKDSDSDSTADGDEIAKGTDPNCPEGKTCGAAQPTDNINGAGSSNVTASALRTALKKSGAPAYVIDQIDDQTLLDQYRSTLVSGVSSSGNVSTQDLGKLSASQIRSLLKANGVADEDSLNSIDDNTLLAIYQDALSNQSSSQ